MKEKVTAIVLAAGKGSRMHSEIQKQYMQKEGREIKIEEMAKMLKTLCKVTNPW